MALKPFRLSIDFDKGWQKMAAALDPETFRANLETNIGKATSMNGMMFRAEIRKRIKTRRYQSNSPFTILLKKSSTPLINDGDLFGAVTSRRLDAYSVFIGVLRGTVDSDGKSIVNLAELLHNGGTIPVTEGMRNMFIMLWQVGQGKRDPATLDGRAAEMAKALGKNIRNIKPLKDSTKSIHIPPRPFLASVFNDPAMHKKARANWEKAVKATFKAQAQQKKPA